MIKILIKYRWLIIGFCFATGLTFAAIIPLSETDPEIRNYVPLKMESRLATDKIENEFGVQDMIMLLFCDSTIITTENLNTLRKVDRDLTKLSGIDSRTSLFTVRKILSTEGMMVVDPVLKTIPDDSGDLEKLKEDLQSNRFARGIVISEDMTTASITATLNNMEKETRTIHSIDSIISLHGSDNQIYTGGLPYIRRYIMKDVRKDAIILVPAALLIMLFILKLSLGSWRSVFMPFSVVLISVSLSMGLVPLLGWKLSIITLLVPIILIAVANNYGIYLVARFGELNTGSESKESVIRKISGSLNTPILFSGLTTIAGIAGLLTHSIIPARQVGILAASGVLTALLISLYLIPALLYSFGKAGKLGNEITKPGPTRIDRILNRLTDMILAWPGRIILISLLITLITASGIFLLKIETNQENYFPKKHRLRQASGIINDKFGGSQTVSVMLSGDILDPAVMKGIDNMTLETVKISGVGNVFSISEAVKEMSRAIFNPDERGYDNIPETREGMAQMFELYNMSGNPDDFKQLINTDYTKAHIIIKLSRPEHDVIKDVKEMIAKLSASIPAGITTGGYAVIMADFARSIIRGQVSSLLLALISVAILLSIVFRSVRGGMVGSIPLFASILIVFGFMGYAGIALDAATALLSSIMIGVGVDFTIQYIWCFKDRIRKGLTYELSTREAMSTIGRSIIINAFSVMAGFSVLMFSGFTSIRFFGYLVVISIGSCLLGALILIPALLIRFRPRFVETETGKSNIEKYEKDNFNTGMPVGAFRAFRSAAGCIRNHE